MKKFLAMVLALCLTLGCAAAMAEKQTVKLVTWGGGEAYRLSTEEFNRRQDEIEFVIEVISNIDEYLSARIAANDLPDMYNLTPYAKVYESAAAGRLADLTGTEAASRLLDSTKDCVSLDGKIYAMPYQELLCRGWFLQPNTYDCGSFVVNGTAVVGKEPKKPYNRCKSTQKGAELYEIYL